MTLAALAAFLTVPSAWAIPGATDRTPAATLLIPFFQTGIASGAHPDDTLFVVNNAKAGKALIHYEVWNIDGRPVGLNGNATLSSFATFSRSMRNLIAPASADIKAKLKVGDFYQGFVTIDAVTVGTSQPPTGVFPFSDDNRLEGYFYYTRTSEGAVSGLSMVPIESYPTLSSSDVRAGFYTLPPTADPTDHREAITPGSRHCVDRLAIGEACGFDFIADRIDLRVFRSLPAAGASSFGVIFTWSPLDPGGPSIKCDSDPGNCDASAFSYTQYNEAGGVVASGTRRLDHAVNVIPFVGTKPGWYTIRNVPNAGHTNTQFYAFSVNAAAPPGGLRWENAFEGFIQP